MEGDGQKGREKEVEWKMREEVDRETKKGYRESESGE